MSVIVVDVGGGGSGFFGVVICVFVLCGVIVVDVVFIGAFARVVVSVVVSSFRRRVCLFLCLCLFMFDFDFDFDCC